MKSEKLDLLLNKVVEYNKPDAAHYRGFLYKSGNEYFIKVVEVDNGDINVNDKEYLTTGEENFITQSDKPKLMRVSLKSWHYRLIKFVLRSNAPTPKTMQNGCPYFWLLIFSLFALPFVLLWKAFIFVLLLIPKAMIWGLEKLTAGWVEGLDDNQAYDIYWGGKYTKMPITAKIYFDKSDDDFFEYFLLEKYKLDGKTNPEEYQKKRGELSQKWAEWKKQLDAKREKREDERYERQRENDRRQLERERQQAIRKAEWNAKMKPLRDGWSKFVDAITIDFDNWKSVIKKTKQFVGALVTVVLLAVSYFVVNGLAYGLTVFVDFSISHWYIYAAIGIAAAAFGIIYVLYLLVSGWLQNVVNKYNVGKKVWYIEPLIYLIWYPIKYVVLGVTYGLYYIICIPLFYIFFKFLWKIVLVNIGKLLWKLLCSLGRGLANSTGVFGEYFNASYTDYCPGIEWVDTEEEN